MMIYNTVSYDIILPTDFFQALLLKPPPQKKIESLNLMVCISAVLDILLVIHWLHDYC